MILLTAQNIGTEVSQELTQEATENINGIAEYFGDKLPTIIAYGIKVLIAIILFLIGRLLVKWISRLVVKSLDRSKADAGAQQFIGSLTKTILYILLIVVLITNLGVETASIAALVGSGGIAIGLALQGSLSNFAGGVLILLLKPFQVGDYIIEDNHNNEGTVKEIQIFYTKLATIDNKIIVIPNGSLANTSLTNVTAGDFRQLDLKITITYDSDLRKAKEIMTEILDQNDSIIHEKDQYVFVSELADYTVILGVRAWARTEEYMKVQWDMLENIKLKLEDAGIKLCPDVLIMGAGKGE